MNKLQLSHLRLKKAKELLKLQFKFYYLNKAGDIRYGRNLIDFVFHPQYTSLLEFFATGYRSKISSSELESTIDTRYSKYILGEYSIVDKGADFKFNTIRNLFKWGFRTKDYMVNHYYGKLSLPVIKLLKKEFADLDVLNIVIPIRVTITTKIIEFANSKYDNIMKDYALLRAGPYRTRDPIWLRVSA
jgi:hypothetical protein